MKLSGLILVIVFLGNIALLSGESAIPLKLHKSLAVEGPDNRQPSGLTIRNDTLFTISDRHHNAIFRLELAGETAEMIPYLNFELPDTLLTSYMDFEGITCDDSSFYLVSESNFRILRICQKTGGICWMSPDLQPVGYEKGLFRVHNAAFEGIALLDHKKFVLCAEREPRGIVELNIDRQPYVVTAYQYNRSKFTFPEGVSFDFTGLYWFGDTLYVLQRNAYVISELIPGTDGFEEGRGWSYRAIETGTQFRYSDMKYGRGEGLALDERFFYVILDNNGDPRAIDTDDNRPLLFILER